MLRKDGTKSPKYPPNDPVSQFNFLTIGKNLSALLFFFFRLELGFESPAVVLDAAFVSSADNFETFVFPPLAGLRGLSILMRADCTREFLVFVFWVEKYFTCGAEPNVFMFTYYPQTLTSMLGSNSSSVLSILS